MAANGGAPSPPPPPALMDRIREMLLRAYPALQEGMRGAHDAVHVKAAAEVLEAHLPVAAASASASEKETVVAALDPNFVPTPALSKLLVAMEEDLANGKDICLVGAKGAGKSSVVAELASRRANAGGGSEEGGSGVSTLPVFKDMTARDLLQRRSTDPVTGATTWEDSPLVAAARRGGLLVLDGVERLPSDVLNTLQRLAHDRYLDLCDGTRLVPSSSPAGATRRAAESPATTGSQQPQPPPPSSPSAPPAAEAVDVLCQPIHDAFRIVALAEPPAKGKGSWLSPETATLFRFHRLAPYSAEDKSSILQERFPRLPATALRSLVAFSEATAPSAPVSGGSAEEEGIAAGGGNSTPTRSPLSMRQLCRLARRLEQFPDSATQDLPALLGNALLLPFMPPTPQKALLAAMEAVGIDAPSARELGESSASASAGNAAAETFPDAGSATMSGRGANESALLRIGRVEAPKRVAKRPELVPSPLFFENAAHTALMEEMLASHVSGERALLLIGNQGVGKNKVADRLLQKLNAEREYVQLHRDTTLQSLTVLPSIEGGQIAWDDSPLVRAVSEGRILVVDEADKAPTEVVCLLKTLLEDGEMLLADGRRILSKDNLRRWQHSVGIGSSARSGGGSYELLSREEAAAHGIVPVHDDFAMWVLANRPGYPFLGNNFFREIGDAFSVFVLHNPEQTSEEELLSAYAPSLAGADGQLVISKLAGAFAELRSLHTGSGSSGTVQLTYPYSMREAVAVVTHLNEFPTDGVAEALENVLAFDSFAPETRQLVASVFQKHGIPLALQAGRELEVPKVTLGVETKLPEQELFEKWSTSWRDDDDDDDDKRTGGNNSSSGGSSSSSASGEGGGGQDSRARAAVEIPEVRARKWGLGLPREQQWSMTSARIASFTEEVGSFSIWGEQKSSSSSSARDLRQLARRHSAISIAASHPTASDGRVHVLSRDPTTLHSFSGAVRGSGPQRSTELLGEMWEWRLQHDSPRLVPLSQPAAGNANGAQTAALGVVFPKQGVVLVLDDSGGEGESLKGVLLEVPSPTGGEPHEALDDSSGLARSSSSAAPSIFASMLGGGSGTALREGSEGRMHVGSALGSVGSLFWFEEGSSSITVVNCGTSVTDGTPSSGSSARHVHVPSNVLPTGGLGAVEVLSPESWILRGTEAGTASILTWPVGVWLDGKRLDDSCAPPTIEKISVTGPDDMPLNQSIPPLPTSTKVVNNKGSSPVPPASHEPDGRFMTHPSSHIMVGHGDSSRRPMRVHVYSSPASEPSSHSARAVHLRPGARSPPSTSTASDDGDGGGAIRRTDSEGKPMNLGFASTRGNTFVGTSGDGRGKGDAENEETATGDLVVSVVRRGKQGVALESVDLTRRLLRTVSLAPSDEKSSDEESSAYFGGDVEDGPSPVVDICALPVAASIEGSGTSGRPSKDLSPLARLATLQGDGRVRLWQVSQSALESEVRAWKRMYGIVDDTDKARTTSAESTVDRLSRTGGITYRDAGGRSIPRTGLKAPKHGKEDAKNEPHVGGNTWAGGTGGSDTAGLGGRGGPYRLDKGHTVHQISDADKALVSDEAKAAAREMGRRGLEDRLREINMGKGQWETYLRYFERIAPQVNQLRNVLEALQQKDSERVWLRHQASGELDDSKLLDGIAGERLVFRRRGESDDPFFNPHKQNDTSKKTRLFFALDVSGSMFRFNGSDGRLERLLECTMMIMEALDGFESKFEYALVGHSGDSPAIPFVEFGSPPTSRKDRLDVLEKMVAHSQFCWSGDHTVEAAEAAISSVRSDENSAGSHDDSSDGSPRHFVFLLSDANLRRYGINAQDLGRTLTRDSTVQGHFVMIASIADEAERARAVMPPGSASVCLDAAQLPQLIKTIVTASIDTH